MKFQPTRTKFNKPHTVIRKGKTKEHLVYGDYGLESKSNWYITDKQLEAVYGVLKKYSNQEKKLKYWFRIFPHMIRTKKPAGVRSGAGKGSPEYYYAPIRNGTILIEITGVSEDMAKEILKQCKYKLPPRSLIIKREK